ncbi:carbohydrate kinase family protein [Streptomyces sp. PAM3C]|uniref:carbohydrate kinase family protein n=1 Tax=Streptomyces sp. PAM3C TaxID=2847300 RepID=UPI001C1E3DCC|nr:PfkB family carbohydrate kinase [Streptomyces sp. PAM3C]MBU5946000.1 carbohydrate kinase family protein [Streptomyces sp. PAM3C]
MTDVVVVGRIAIDEWVLSEKEQQSARTPADTYGGSGANMATLLARLGMNVGLVAKVGCDDVGRHYRDRLIELGVNVNYLQTGHHRTAVCRIIPGIAYEWLDDVIAFPSVTASDLAGALAGAEIAIFSDCAPGRDVVLPEASYWVPQLWLRSPLREPMAALLPWRAVFVNSRERDELEKLIGTTVGELSKRTSTTWIVTDESKDTVCWQSGISSHHQVDPVAPVVALGGGDALAAAFAFARYEGLSMETAIEFGHAAARKVVQQVACQLEQEHVDELLLIVAAMRERDGFA